MRPPIRCPLVLLARSVGPCGACPCSTPTTEGRVKCYQNWAVGIQKWPVGPLASHAGRARYWFVSSSAWVRVGGPSDPCELGPMAALYIAIRSCDPAEDAVSA